MYFDRFDICEAYLVFHYGWSDGGYATGRRERYAGETNSDIRWRLTRIGYRPSPLFGYAPKDLSENGLRIYAQLVKRKVREWRRQDEARQRLVG